MRDVLREPLQASLRYSDVARRTIVYALAVFLMCALFLAFMSIKIMPQFERIMADFSLRPPEPFLFYQGFARIVAALWLPVALAVCGALWMMFATARGRAVRQNVLSRSSRSLSELRAAEVLRKLRVAIDGGRPIAGALSTLARYHFDPVVRSKLLFVRNEVEQGADPWQSMMAVDLLSSEEVRLLATAERLDNRGWAMDQLIHNKRRIALRRLERATDLLLPILLVLLGCFVLLQASAVVAPLTHLLSVGY